ncbi:MAG: hypothetical protein AB7V12_02710 [Candidatus Dadabacteria bacterium]
MEFEVPYPEEEHFSFTGMKRGLKPVMDKPAGILRKGFKLSLSPYLRRPERLSCDMEACLPLKYSLTEISSHTRQRIVSVYILFLLSHNPINLDSSTSPISCR